MATNSIFKFFAKDLKTFIAGIGGVLIISGFASNTLSDILRPLGIYINGWDAIFFGSLLIILAVVIHFIEMDNKSNYF